MYKTREQKIEEFHQAFGAAIDENPTVKLLELRKTLITEEIKELISDIDDAIKILQKGNTVPAELYANMLKEMADVQVVLSGTAVALKPLRNLDEAFDRVHQSNMSKLGEDGKPIYREDGKVLKGPNYKAPFLDDLV